MRSLVLTLFVVSALAFPGRVTAQGGNMSIWGDVKIVETKLDTPAPLSVTIVLHNISEGRQVGRQNVSGRGRYRFVGLRPGDYEVAVETQEGDEVTRVRISVTNTQSSDFRQDFEFEWKPKFPAPKSTPLAISAADLYDRHSENKPLFKSAQEAAGKKKYDEAVALLKQILDNDKLDFQVWTLLGTVYFVQEKLAEAEKAYLTAIQTKPAFGQALLNLGKLRRSQKRYEESIDPLTRAVSAHPQSAEANFLLGESYLQVKRGSKAVPYLNEAAKLGWLDAHLRLAWLYDAAGLKDKASHEYEQLLKKKPDYPDRKKLEQYIGTNKKS